MDKSRKYWYVFLGVNLWKKGAYINGSANKLTRQKIERLPKRGAFFMVSLAYLVKRRFVAPENRVRFPEIPKGIKSHSSRG